MSKKKKNNYYELLEVQPDASNMDIINAYRQAKLTYKTDSIATYSLFDDVELERIRTEIENAYDILSHIEKRQIYDAELAQMQSNDKPSPDNLSVLGLHHDNVVDMIAKARRNTSNIE